MKLQTKKIVTHNSTHKGITMTTTTISKAILAPITTSRHHPHSHKADNRTATPITMKSKRTSRQATVPTTTVTLTRSPILEITFSIPMIMPMMANNLLILTNQGKSIETTKMANLLVDTESRRVQIITAIEEKQLI